MIDEHIPTRVMLLVNDLMAYRFKKSNLVETESENSNFSFPMGQYRAKRP